MAKSLHMVRALTYTAHIAATAAQLAELLNNAKSVRHDGYGQPDWLLALERAHDYIGRALAEVSRKASVTDADESTHNKDL